MKKSRFLKLIAVFTLIFGLAAGDLAVGQADPFAPTTVQAKRHHHKRRHKKHRRRNLITVYFHLKHSGHKYFANKKVRVRKNSKVITGLRHAWRVRTGRGSQRGMVTSIHGHSQSPAKRIYWIYYINGKEPNKGAFQQTLHNHNRVTWVLKRF